MVPSWYDGPLAAFGVGASGDDPENDRVIAAALAVQETPGAAPALTRWLISPGVEISGSAAAAHGLTAGHLARRGRWPAPAVDEIARALTSQAASGRPVAVLNAPFTLTLLDREATRHRATSLTAYLGTHPLYVLDPLVLDTRLDRYRKGTRTLADLRAHYDVKVFDNDRNGSGRTAEDTLAVLELTRTLGRRFAARLARLRPDELHALQTTWYEAQVRDRQTWFPGGAATPADARWPMRTPAPATAPPEG
ncbi:3'-5' exonuclease family protein [Streptomyces sp. BBFR2]|uniref:3'-5' exonuclease n=1 Tax=Streptomyces sp. BBFR2 TaxID=3372854 RepID=UPI0037D9B5F0